MLQKLTGQLGDGEHMVQFSTFWRNDIDVDDDNDNDDDDDDDDDDDNDNDDNKDG